MSDSAYDPEHERTTRSSNQEYHMTDKDDKSQVPIVSDNQVEQVVDKEQDSDAQLARDDADAIDESNILDERTRGAKPQGSYKEPADNEGMPKE